MEINPEETTTMKAKPTNQEPQSATQQNPITQAIHTWSGRTKTLIGVMMAVLGVLVYAALADDPPVLTISNLGSNTFSVVITNVTSPTNYLLEWTPVLADTNYPWLVVATNAPGQTNFTMDMGPWPVGFLRVMVGWDADNDSVPSWMDAQPFNSSVGVLSVTIDSPLNGAAIY